MKLKFVLVFVLFAVLMFSLIIINSVRQIQQATSVMVSYAGMPMLNRTAAIIDGDRYELLTQTLDESDPY